MLRISMHDRRRGQWAKHIPNESYDFATVALMGRVFDTAIEALTSAGITFDETIKSVMARWILSAIANGERHFDFLVQLALDAINSQRPPAAPVQGYATRTP
jgi:hypothetical protein